MLVKEVVGAGRESCAHGRARKYILVGRAGSFIIRRSKLSAPRVRRESLEAARESRRTWVGLNLKHSKKSHAHGCPRQPALTLKEE